MADPEPETARTYADLKRRLKSTIFVPVHNAAVSVTFAAQDFLASGIECGPVRIARLSYLVRRVIDRANFSFASYITETGGERSAPVDRTDFDKISGTRIALVCEQAGDIFEFGQRKQSTKLRDRRTLGHLPRASTCFPLSAIGLAPQYRHEPDIQRPFDSVG